MYDKHAVFADHLILPRMILPLGNGQVVIGETEYERSFSLHRHRRRRRLRQRKSCGTTAAVRGAEILSTSRAAWSGRWIMAFTRLLTITACVGRPTGPSRNLPATTTANGARARTITGTFTLPMPAANADRRASRFRWSMARVQSEGAVHLGVRSGLAFGRAGRCAGRKRPLSPLGQDPEPFHGLHRSRDLPRRPPAVRTQRKSVHGRTCGTPSCAAPR